MAKKKTDTYFSAFENMVAISIKAVEKLEEILKNFNVDALPERLDELHVIESEGDKAKHTILETLAKDFVTPIDREDIFNIVSEIDDVTDAVEDVLIKIYMYNIRSITSHALEFAAIARKCCHMLGDVMSHFSRYRQAKDELHKSIIAINDMEENGDDLYIRAMHALYTAQGDPLETMGWTEIYGCLENCCDNCEDVADVIEGVIMKNS